ncbi:unnamed protein product, partial [Ixodes hexagonus]
MSTARLLGALRDKLRCRGLREPRTAECSAAPCSARAGASLRRGPLIHCGALPCGEARCLARSLGVRDPEGAGGGPPGGGEGRGQRLRRHAIHGARRARLAGGSRKTAKPSRFA